MQKLFVLAFFVFLLKLTLSSACNAQQQDVFRRNNLVAWCIVPFDSQHRTPQQRAEMLEKLGLKQLAYDYRAEHIPSFDDEIEQLKKRNIKLFAWWFPTELNDEAKMILRVLEKHGEKTQLWVTGGGAPIKSPEEQRQRVLAESRRIRTIAEAAAKIGCSVGLYNHGGWFGEPENQIAIIDELKLPNVGIVYNQHHGHSQVDRFKELLVKMKPHLMALNLNGMVPNGDNISQKIVPLGSGSLDVTLLKTIRESGYQGPIGILNHTDHDAEARLKDNLDGLDWLLPQLDGKLPTAKPTFRTWTAPTAQTSLPAKPSVSKLVDGSDAFRNPPMTVVCDAKLTQSQQYNILVASDTKASGQHWELFSQAGSGVLASYFPGHRPDLITSSANVCDGKPHQFAMIYESHRVRMYVDQRLVSDQAIERTEKPAVPGGFAIGSLVEGGLQCFGEIGSVQILRGVADVSKLNDSNYLNLQESIGRWQFASFTAQKQSSDSQTAQPITAFANYEASVVKDLAAALSGKGQADRGVALFASSKSACISCHKIGKIGGAVGPELTTIGKQRTVEQLIESLLWPNRLIEPKYRVTQLLTNEGEMVRGYLVQDDKQSVVIADPSTAVQRKFEKSEIEGRTEAPSLMPEGLANIWSRDQVLDVVAFLADLGHHQRLRPEIAESVLEHAQPHAPKDFAFDRGPLNPKAWPNSTHPVNRDRIYDFYSKQANHFRVHDLDHRLLMEFPGLDGGNQGHWGNQTEATWESDEWNKATLGSVQSSVLTAPKQTIARGVALQLGEDNSLFTCFDPDTLTYPVLWTGKFCQFSNVRHGFVSGLTPGGPQLDSPNIAKPIETYKYHGFYRVGRRIVFAYRVGDQEYLDMPWADNGKFTREFAPREKHSMRDKLSHGSRQWPQTIETAIRFGSESPYAIDTIELPVDNPWHIPIYCGGHDFLPDGSALVATMQGDVWHVSGFVGDQTKGTGKAIWRRFASGLHHALGVKIDHDGIFVMCRDQLTRLHDLNGDGEADFYECFSNAFETSPAGHDYICGLQRDRDGNFYMASGNEGLVQISKDGKIAKPIAEGFRNPDGLGIYPDGVVTLPCSEGEWTPASMIAAVTPKSVSDAAQDGKLPFYGYRGQKISKRPIEQPHLPMIYLPRGLDNSAGEQVYIDSHRWGPMTGQMVHLSFGTGSHFLLLRDQVGNQLQGAVVPLQGDFLSGLHRGRFSPVDGQLYVSGMAGWGSYTRDHGCFQRIRYTGERVQLPNKFHVHRNGIAIGFPNPLDQSVTGESTAHFAQAWNYRYSGAYGSSEYSALHYGMRGHDRLKITSSRVLDNGRTLFLEIPDLIPCNQLHLNMAVDSQQRIDMFLTCNALDNARTDFPNPSPVNPQIAKHPLNQDMAIAARRVPNPWRNEIPNARKIGIAAGKNLTYDTRTILVKADESISLTLNNPDVVPHNWVLIRPGKLQTIGSEANKLVGDPEALIRHYVPQSSDVVCFTDIVDAQDSTTIHFRVPKEPGRYPYLCTFPGHWMVMNGEMIVE
jgi:putative heme-binding domain-containing protein